MTRQALPVCTNGILRCKTSGNHDGEILLFYPVKPAEFAVIDEHCRWKKSAVEKDKETVSCEGAFKARRCSGGPQPLRILHTHRSYSEGHKEAYVANEVSFLMRILKPSNMGLGLGHISGAEREEMPRASGDPKRRVLWRPYSLYE